MRTVPEIFGKPSVDFQLGALGVNWDRAQLMIRDLHAQASAQHSMGAEAKAAIIDDHAVNTGKRLCYNGGTDGGDDRLWIEDIPYHHVDWDMTEAEWEELRRVLQKALRERPQGSLLPYLCKLYDAGKLGKPVIPCLRTP